jgi:hypothetical protein
MHDLDAVLDNDPHNAQGRLSRAFIRMVTGDLTGAAKDCLALPTGPALLVREICKARIETLSGHAEHALARLTHLTRLTSVDTADDGAMMRFALAVMAEAAETLGRHDEAEACFKRAMADDTVDAALVAAYADHLLDVNRPAEALRLLDRRGGESDIILLRKVIAAKQLDDSRFDGWQISLDERFAAARAGGIRVHLREEARFLLDVKGDAKGALALARQNWQVQKEPADARIFVAAALAAGEPQAAGKVIDFIDRTGLRDARLTPLLSRLGARL